MKQRATLNWLLAMNDGPSAIVTGAGSGIGRETAILLAHAGHAVALVGRTEAKLVETQSRIGGEDCLVISADLCNAESADWIVERTMSRFGRVDALCNVAGDAPLMPIEQVTPETWRRCIDTNLSCIVHLTAKLLPVMYEQERGVIVNVSSMASIDPFPGLAIYAAAKAGLNMFTQCTAREGAAHGIRAVCVAPDAVETPMLRGLFDKAMIPSEKTLDPRDVATVIRDCVIGGRHFEMGETILVKSQA